MKELILGLMRGNFNPMTDEPPGERVGLRQEPLHQGLLLVEIGFADFEFFTVLALTWLNLATIINLDLKRRLIFGRSSTTNYFRSYWEIMVGPIIYGRAYWGMDNYGRLGIVHNCMLHAIA